MSADSLTIPTRKGQGLGGFLEELRDAARKLLYLASNQADAWVSVEWDSVTGAEFVAELHGDGEPACYRVTYSRGEDGRIALGEPVAVREVTTYEPVNAPPVAMARAVLCESLPVHAPPAEGLTRGRPVQLLRIGPLFDAQTGESLLDVTDALCADIASGASALGFAVPIDMGHALYRAAAGEAPQLYGRIVEIEARPGSGLWGTPEWTGAGSALLSTSPGLYYLSPTLLGAPSHPQTGEAMPGRMLHSASLTPTPRQDRIESLALSRGDNGGARMGDQTPRTPAVNPDVVTLARADHAALLDRVTGAERRVTELSAQLAAEEAARNAATAEATTLAQDVAALKADKLAREFRDLCATHEARGVVVTAEMRTALAKVSPDVAAVLLSQMSATRPAAEAGHGGTVQPPADANDPATIRKAVALSREKGIDFNAAMTLARGAA